MRNGVPPDEARTMDRDERLAYVIVIGKLDGGEWDWGSMTWKERKT